MTIVARDITPKDRSIAFLIFGFLLACYLLTFTGQIDSSDGLSMFSTSESVVRRGAIDMNQLLWMGNQQGNIGVGGDLYSRKGIGMVLLAVPLILGAKIWPAVGLVHAALLLNPLLTAWTGALLFRAGRRLGWRRGTSVAIALLFGLATMAWPYTQGYFSDPICAWGLFAAAYGMLAYAQSGRKHYLFAAGVAWGIAYTTRTINLLTLPIYMVGLFIVLDSLLPQRFRQLTWPARLSAIGRRGWRPTVTFLIPVVAAGLLSLWWNWARFGSVWETGYVETESFSANWLTGLFGLTVGPARGFFWYNPILLLVIPGALWFWRRQRAILLLSLALVLLYVAVYGKWYMWHGGFSWGPRFLVPLLPFLSLLAAPGWEQLVSRQALGWFGQFLGYVLALFSVIVQWLGMLVPYTLVQNWLANNIEPLFAPETFTRLEVSPLIMQWRYLTSENIQLAWWRSGAPDPIDWLGLLMPLSGVVVGMILLLQQARTPEDNTHDDALRNWLYAGALVVIALAMLTYYQVTLADTEVQILASRIQNIEADGDAVLLLRPDQSQAFANSYKGNRPVYGFFGSEELAEADAAWLQRLREIHTRIWVVPDALPPERSGWEEPLRTGEYLLVDERISGESDQRIALYAIGAQAGDLMEVGLGTVFGAPDTEERVTDQNGWIRLSGYAMTAQTTPGGNILLSLLWESLQPVAKDYQVFVHLVDRDGNMVAQRDGQPVQWMRPTSTWLLGEEIVDHYGMLLPDTFPTGRYSVLVGMYDAVTGQRLPVSAGPANFAIDLGAVEVR